jgi:hypothetical protein
MGEHNFATKTTYVDSGVKTLHVTGGDGEAIFAASFGTTGLPAISGYSNFSEAVVGVAGGQPGDDGTNGVRGTSSNPIASGVYGENLSGGFGVAGRSNAASGTGVYGEALGGGVALAALAGPGGTALSVSGVADFSQSGIAKFHTGDSQVTVTVAGMVTGSLALATLQRNAPGIWVRAAVPDVLNSRITIYLNQAVTQLTLVGYFVLH